MAPRHETPESVRRPPHAPNHIPVEDRGTVRRPPHAPNHIPVEDRGIVRRWRERRDKRKRARLVSARSRRALAKRIRRAAEEPQKRSPIGRREHDLLQYRVASVRTDLFEIAALLEHVHKPDPACVVALDDLLSRSMSPLHDPSVAVAELHTTLDYARRALRHAS